ncbi:serine/threonine protein kinase [Saccharibacillus sp. O23]|uniref:serine/threonine protein kinase n=1 Tax=Saccharibacillus sp. O23 TaxID=2009338 RepID=UPI00211AB7D6|nr:serine/threonine protein kinase [Saccharibacillus sp. O23]
MPGDLIEQRIDGVPFVLRRPHDFNWLAPFGQVFRVWDRQDSGNLAFGLTIEDQKVFIKYAGAFTADYDGHPVDAVRRLREAAGVYEVLRHPALVRVLDHFETTDGYAVLYEWAEGKLLRPGAESGAADAVISRFRRLPVEERLEAMDTILDFHAYVEALNYVAIDFYDGSLIYDFEAKRMTICDIDFYRPKPYANDMGRMWGSSRFMSPEEHEFGATIDSRTNVYAMGAMAFHLLGGERDRSRDLWEAGNERYEIALRAVSPERAQRWESVDAMLEAWRSAR